MAINASNLGEAVGAQLRGDAASLFNRSLRALRAAEEPMVPLGPIEEFYLRMDQLDQAMPTSVQASPAAILATLVTMSEGKEAGEVANLMQTVRGWESSE
jgi:hypothetical protein